MWFLTGEAKRGLMSVNHLGPMRSMPQANRMRGKARYESASHHTVKATYEKPMMPAASLVYQAAVPMT